MHPMRWEPFRDSDEFFRSLTSPVFGRKPSMSDDNGGSRMEWAPAVDIKETDGEYLVLAEIPGIKREDVKVTLEDSVLTVEGERKHEHAAEGERSHRVERFYGSFRRRFTLPEDADAGSIRAECKDGVLSVHVPKRELEKQKAVEIKVD